MLWGKLFDWEEIVPGLVRVEGDILICPGCGLEAEGKDPTDDAAILAWIKSVFEIHADQLPDKLRQAGPEVFAAHYRREPWHASE